MVFTSRRSTSIKISLTSTGQMPRVGDIISDHLDANNTRERVTFNTAISSVRGGRGQTGQNIHLLVATGYSRISTG